MEGKASITFPIRATAVVVFVASAAVTYMKIGFHARLPAPLAVGVHHRPAGRRRRLSGVPAGAQRHAATVALIESGA
jgi:hypothetical protein